MESEDLFAQQNTEEIVDVPNSFNEIGDIPMVSNENNMESTEKINHGEILSISNTVENVKENNNEKTDNMDSADTTEATENKIKSSDPKLINLPVSKIRALMKLDPDLQLASNEAVFSVTKATELFIQSLAKESFTFTAQSKKKTVQKRDVDLAIASVDSLMFLEGSMNF